ncbi:MAG TPA: hypothetical protein VFV19_15325 [Candidatus Polarisedimenticolaceae bacterium]|nr:hypothetical protein [Candidatus Polarisedimenticolaceae bacterium]
METRKHDILDDAVAAWRAESQDETLSGAARTALFDEVRAMGQGREAAFIPALTKAWRWAFLGSVPVLAIASALFVATERHPSPMAHLSAAKVDGQVVFTLANGNSSHVVRRSTDPRGLSNASPTHMAGNRYTDEATGGPNLVFYRID